ncbi:MAG: TMEM43 family protein [Verrucomicrobia bacterium]|nr:TMEM43 family protein [Verrucomicrobiota bacterium]MDA1006569.1 TMEM43 family protein [Verrucomicrobiota bacterium]
MSRIAAATVAPPLRAPSRVSNQHALLHPALLTKVGQKRPGVKRGQPLKEAQAKASPTSNILTNPTFGIEEKAIRISWNTSIYQWVEKQNSETKKKLGGGEETVTTFSYEKKWADSPVDSSSFKEAGHTNTKAQTYQSGSEQATTVTLGAFQLAPGLISQIHSSEPYAPAELPTELATLGQLSDGVFHTGELGNPKIGDEKVEFTITHPGDVSVMATQSKNSFKPYMTKSGKEKFLLYEGLLSADEVVDAEESKAKFLRWALRGLGVLLMFIGFTLILKPLSVLADVIPFLGSLVGGATALIALLLSLGISLVIIAISWIFFRPLLGISLLVLAIGCMVLLIKKTAQGRKQAALTA